MKMRVIISVAIAATAFVLAGDAFARTASCPCGATCPCAPCTCGAGGSKGGKHHEKEGGHEHGGVGVGVNVDLSRVGQQKPEGDPFATSGGTTSQTHERSKTKTKESGTTTDPFNDVKVTGDKAKEENNPPGPINISDNASPPQTQEKPQEKPKEKGPDYKAAIDKLPAGYKIEKTPDGPGFYAAYDSVRPSRHITWDDKHGVWRPPGLLPQPGDEDRLFDTTTGQNAVWDEKSKSWIDTKTGKALGYEQ